MTIFIIDYGVGNIGSLANMLEFIGIDAMVTDLASDIANATKLILPGVGAFDTAIINLTSRGLVSSLNEAVTDRKVPVLGICLGMQILANDSEEGVAKGLGWIDGSVVRLSPKDPMLKVPHIGWSTIQPTVPSGLFPNVDGKERFYFVHSYFLKCRDSSDVAATLCYGDRICVAVSKGNVHGVQFHPEKSHRYGAALLKRFCES